VVVGLCVAWQGLFSSTQEVEFVWGPNNTVGAASKQKQSEIHQQFAVKDKYVATGMRIRF
jgi:hypothetical protein